jgi:hypothetical protein
MTRFSLVSVAAFLGLVLAGCPTTMDRSTTLPRLQRAIGAEVTGAVELEDHNQLVEDVVHSGVLEGMFQSELEEALGRGTECGARELCAQHHFRQTDWTYDVGHAPGDPSLPAGPTLVVGFDRTGRVDNTYYQVRRGPESHPQ